MSSVREISGSLQVAIKKTNDDADISFIMITQWVKFFINKFRSAKAEATTSGLYVSTYEVSVTTDSNNRKYITLPTNIYDYEGDRGIDYITINQVTGVDTPMFTGYKFSRTTPGKARSLYYSEYERPTPENPYFYRLQNSVYFLGVEAIGLNTVEVGLKSEFNPFAADYDLDEDLYLDPAVEADVYKNVLEISRFVMQIPQDSINQGKDEVSPEAAPSQRLVSLNEKAQ